MIESVPPLDAALAFLQSGQTIGLPTETVYGLAADALQPAAVAQIFSIKGRPYFDPLIIHVADQAGAVPYVAEWPSDALALTEAFWPGPLTLVLPKRSIIPDLVTSGLPFVAIRAPRHPIAQALLRAYGRPLAAPSANRFGRVSPTTAMAVREELGNAVPLVLDGGSCSIGLESTIVAFPEGRPTLLRAGGIPIEALEQVIGPIASQEKGLIPIAGAAPGQLPQHYAPRTPLRLISSPAEVPIGERPRCALLGWGTLDTEGFAAWGNLSKRQIFAEAATHFFSLLRELDGSGVHEIVAQLLPEEDLGRAINDRLRRAAHR